MGYEDEMEDYYDEEEFNKKKLEQLKKEIEKLIKEITKEAKLVVEDYTSNPSHMSGSIVQIHETSPFLDEKNVVKKKKK